MSSSSVRQLRVNKVENDEARDTTTAICDDNQRLIITAAVPALPSSHSLAHTIHHRQVKGQAPARLGEGTIIRYLP